MPAFRKIFVQSNNNLFLRSNFEVKTFFTLFMDPSKASKKEIKQKNFEVKMGKRLNWILSKKHWWDVPEKGIKPTKQSWSLKQKLFSVYTQQNGKVFREIFPYRFPSIAPAWSFCWRVNCWYCYFYFWSPLPRIFIINSVTLLILLNHEDKLFSYEWKIGLVDFPLNWRAFTPSKLFPMKDDWKSIAPESIIFKLIESFLAKVSLVSVATNHLNHSLCQQKVYHENYMQV